MRLRRPSANDEGKPLFRIETYALHKTYGRRGLQSDLLSREAYENIVAGLKVNGQNTRNLT